MFQNVNHCIEKYMMKGDVRLRSVLGRQGRAGVEFLTGHISVVRAQMKYEDEQSESTIDAVGRSGMYLRV